MLRKLADGPLAARVGRERLFRRVIGVAGRGESHVEQALLPCYARWKTWPLPIDATILAAMGQVELHLTVRTADEAEGLSTLERAVADVKEAIGVDIFSDRGESLEEVVGRLLTERGLKVAAAESCTGGLLTSRLTDVPGSSNYVERTIVAYSNEAKIDLLGVPRAMIAEHGAVSEPVAAAMADGVRERAGVDLGIAITGIAGPGGGTEAKPVGTVAIALAGPGDARRVRTFTFIGGRLQVKFQASQVGARHDSPYAAAGMTDRLVWHRAPRVRVCARRAAAVVRDGAPLGRRRSPRSRQRQRRRHQRDAHGRLAARSARAGVRHREGRAGGVDRRPRARHASRISLPDYRRRRSACPILRIGIGRGLPDGHRSER